MIEKWNNEAKSKKQYVSVLLETLFLDREDVITASIQDSQADNDVNKDDIFD